MVRVVKLFVLELSQLFFDQLECSVVSLAVKIRWVARKRVVGIIGDRAVGVGLRQVIVAGVLLIVIVARVR